jgi:hypothetical protein
MSIVIGKLSQQKAPIAGAFLVSADSYRSDSLDNKTKRFNSQVIEQEPGALTYPVHEWRYATWTHLFITVF